MGIVLFEFLSLFNTVCGKKPTVIIILTNLCTINEFVSSCDCQETLMTKVNLGSPPLQLLHW